MQAGGGKHVDFQPIISMHNPHTVVAVSQSIWKLVSSMFLPYFVTDGLPTIHSQSKSLLGHLMLPMWALHRVGRLFHFLRTTGTVKALLQMAGNFGAGSIVPK